MAISRTRIRRYRRPVIVIPSSTPQSLVFPYDERNRRFDLSSYQAAQTQGRVTAEEIEEFLKEVNVPVRAFYEEQMSACKLVCIIIFCMICFPLYPFMLCWICYRNKKNMEEMKKATERASVIIKSRGTMFTERGLAWNIPAYFPKWIELWTQIGEYGQPVMQPMMQPEVQVNQQFQGMPIYQRPPGEVNGAAGFSGIEMQAVPQQTYQQGYYQQQNYSNYQNNFAPNNQV